MKKILIAMTIIIGSLNVYATDNTSNSSNDIFNSTKKYASSITTKDKIQILNQGISLDKYTQDKVKEKSHIIYKLKAYNKTRANNTKSTDSSSTKQTTTSYTGTTNYTDSSRSSNDAVAHMWSCINSDFDVYDDKGADNVTILASAYTSSARENGGYAGLNAINGRLGAGQVASPKDIPFHTKIRITGLGMFDVTDRGGAIVRIDRSTIRLDVWHASYSEAMKFGRRTYRGRIMPK